MIKLLQNTNLMFRADYSQKALKTRQVLRVEWAKGNHPSDALLQDIKDQKYEILSHINKELIKLHSPFAEALTVISTRNKPEFITQKKWDQILLSFSGLLSDHLYWLHQIINNGWGIKDIFGCHSTNPQNRIDCMGLLLLSHGKEIVEVSRDCIVLKTEGGATQSYRSPLRTSSEQTTLDLLP